MEFNGFVGVNSGVIKCNQIQIMTKGTKFKPVIKLRD